MQNAATHEINHCGVQVGKPAEVRDAEQASSPVSDDTILRVITDFNVGVGKYTKLVRRLLPKYAGYECKEPEGKFTLSFRYATRRLPISASPALFPPTARTTVCKYLKL